MIRDFELPGSYVSSAWRMCCGDDEQNSVKEDEEAEATLTSWQQKLFSN